ncbi:MAG: glycosyltransferase [Clostridiales bacterium]|nr:glycosyltransferase [Clostridiales bacterium]
MNNGDPLFSIIITTYNSEATVRACIDSVLEQSETSYEIIIVDDASTDGTPEIIRQYTAAHPNIRGIFHSENQQKPRGLNEGIRDARGRYISIIDSDDWVGKECYTKRRKRLEETGFPDVLISGLTAVSNDKETVIKTPFPLNRKMNFDELLRSCSDIHTGRHLCFSWRMLFSRKMLTDNDIFVNESITIGEDFDFNFRAMKIAESIVACDESEYRYSLISTGSLMRSRCKKNLEESVELQYNTRVSAGMDIGSYRSDLLEYYVRDLTFIVITNQINSPEGLTPAALKRILNRRCFRETWKMTGFHLYGGSRQDIFLRLMIKFRLTRLYCRVTGKK